jgi:hypothetical protein
VIIRLVFRFLTFRISVLHEYLVSFSNKTSSFFIFLVAEFDSNLLVRTELYFNEKNNLKR